MDISTGTNTIPLSFRIAQYAATVLAAGLTGGCLAVSGIAIPTLSHAPAKIRVEHWSRVYVRGFASAPPLVVGTTVAYVYLAIEASRLLSPPSPMRTRAVTCYSLAALSLISIIPFTVLVMAKTNNALHAKASALRTKGKGDVGKGQKCVDSGVDVTSAVDEAKEANVVHELLGKWGVLNYARGVFAFVGCVLGLAAL